MKLYSTGLMGILASVISLVAGIQINEKFNITNPYVFWIGQIVFLIIFIGALLYALSSWDKKSNFPKMRLYQSIIIFILMYAIAFIGSKYSLILILMVGITENYFTRKRANLIITK